MNTFNIDVNEYGRYLRVDSGFKYYSNLYRYF